MNRGPVCGRSYFVCAYHFDLKPTVPIPSNAQKNEGLIEMVNFEHRKRSATKRTEYYALVDEKYATKPARFTKIQIRGLRAHSPALRR